MSPTCATGCSNRTALILPSRFELYCEPVMVRNERRVPFLWELNVHGYDYSCLEQNRPDEPEYYRLRGSDTGFVDHFLGEPEPVLAVDLHTLNETDLPHELRFARTVVQAGRLDGFAIYFRARVMTTQPRHQPAGSGTRAALGLPHPPHRARRFRSRGRDRSQAHGRPLARPRTLGAGATQNAPPRTGAPAPVRSGKATLPPDIALIFRSHERERVEAWTSEPPLTLAASR